jgi:phosphofructokinase-like protein
MAQTKRIGVLTSGGDCAGLNAAIRAIVNHAIRHYGWEVMGVKDATLGLMRRPLDMVPLTLDCFDGTILRLGGTLLGTTNKGDPFAFSTADGAKRDRSGDFVEGFHQSGLDGLITIGGDGSLRILSRLCAQGGIPFVAIPKTIDNDVPGTEYAIGYATAVDIAVDALDRLQPTAASHHRVMVLEVMGRDSGFIALAAGVAGGADIVLLPELNWSIDDLAAKIRAVTGEGRNHALVVVAEGVRTENGARATALQAQGETRYGGIGQYLAARIAEATGAETRVTVLGHVQRGGTPTPQDRLLASMFGTHAVDLVAAGKWGRMVAWHNDTIGDVPIAAAIGGPAMLQRDHPLLATARALGIYIGG